MTELYADIVLPIARPAFTFRVGPAMRGNIREGMCVKVQLGWSKLYTGIIWRLHNHKPDFKTIKSIDEPIPGSPTLPAAAMKFWEWVAAYYMCTLGEVMRAAMPSALKPSGFSNEEFVHAISRPRLVQYVALHPSISDEGALSRTFEALKRAPRQYEALMEFISAFPEDEALAGELPRNSLRADSVALKNLVRKNAIVITERELKSDELPPLPASLPRLTSAQATALDDIRVGFGGHGTVLLHGVTGSGKTEIYLHLIRKQLAAEKNVMYLLPEIAMTSQLVARIREHFGQRVVVYHSGMGERARIESYLRANRSPGGELILGVRSAIFMPVDNLGLVIVDEEHDTSFKQNETAPRYNARDCAVVLSRIHGARALLGSATPSVESWFNVGEGKYALATLAERYGGARMPRIIVSDTLTAIRRGERTSHFNKLLLDRISAALDIGQQVMLFQNRRGFAPYIECTSCGHVPMCPSCNVALTLHKGENRLQCHYCGSTHSVPAACPACGKGPVEARGFGTEKVGEELARLFPEARVVRLDRDSARSQSGSNAIIAAFTRGEADILVGTQMITKGFDFAGVSLVGILNADNLLNYPDFRAGERAFQLITQMAGRAGRREKQGEVIIQTSQPDNQIIMLAAASDYTAMAKTQLAERAAFFYPPYCRLIGITMKGCEQAHLTASANRLAGMLGLLFGRKLLGPQAPTVDRIKDEYLLSLLIKVDREEPFSQAKALLAQALKAFAADKRNGGVKATVNVDPV